MVVPYNDDTALDAAFATHGPRLAAVIVEGVAANMGLVPPGDGFLAGLRRRCSEAGALLIMDEVITGFRLGNAGAQGRYGIEPDLSCFGKVLGGGLPLAAFGGRAEIMDHLAPLGPVYQAGTLSGNPLATAAGLAVLARLDDAAYVTLEATAINLADGRELKVPHRDFVSPSPNFRMLTVWHPDDSCDFVDFMLVIGFHVIGRRKTGTKTFERK